MKFILFCLICLLTAFWIDAQVTITGKVMGKDTNSQLAGASIVIKDSNGKICKFTRSKGDGNFIITTPTTYNYHLEISMIGFTKQSIPLDSAPSPIWIYMEPAETTLKEVTIKARKIREQGDTIIYNVGSFAQEHDRTIGDVLKRMPGINVEQSGKIKYQGEDINKFYIEGADMLGGKYGIATNGISHDDVGTIEVMENHQPMQVLSGIAFSDKAAINLKLKNKAKATWTYHGKLGAGHSWQPDGTIWDGELFAMAVMPGFQNLTTFQSNNTGNILSAQLADLFATQYSTNLKESINISLSNIPAFSSRRTFFNRSAIFSANNLWKFRRGELKAQIDYSFNRMTEDAKSITTYFSESPIYRSEAQLNTYDNVIVETESGRDMTNSLNAQLSYELNNKTTYINNTLRGNISWTVKNITTTGSLPNNQSASLTDYHACNDFRIIKRFNNNHLVTFGGKIEWESLPQSLSVYGENIHSSKLFQDIKDHSFYTRCNASYTFAVKGISVSIEGGLKGYLRTFHSEMPNLPEEIPEETINVVNTDYVTIYSSPKFEYWINKLDFTMNIPISFTTYHFDKSLADRSDIYCSPSISVNWKPNNYFSAGISGGIGRRPMDLNLVQPGFVMTNYRSFRQGISEFYNTSSKKLSANITYKKIIWGLFGNASVSHSWNQLPYTMSQQLFGDYIIYSYTSARSNSKNLMVNAEIGKTINILHGGVNLYGIYNRSESLLLSQNKNVNSIGTMWSAGIKLNCKPIFWVNFDYKFGYSSNNLTMNNSKASWLSSVKNELLINIMPHKKWEWHIIGEHYTNELSTDNYKSSILMDTRIRYKMTKHTEFSITLNNALNCKSYNYITYNQLSSFESCRQIRGRELLFTISIRK